MIFRHNEKLEKTNLVRDDSGEYRHYVDEEGKRYLSVTSFISMISDKKAELEAWRSAVGQAEADAICSRAAEKGTNIHLACENLILNRDNPGSHLSMFERYDFIPLKNYLEKNVNDVLAVEHQMKSDKLKLAGTSDLIAHHKNELAIIDYKTSSRIKYRDEIFGYFLQSACYGIMLYENYGIKPKKIVILMAVDKDPNVLVFEEDIVPWMKQILEKRKETLC